MAAALAQAQPAPPPSPLPPAGSSSPDPSVLTLLDVPFVSQTEALCGGAAAAMVLRYWGERGVTAETFAPLVDRSAAGIRTNVLVRDLTERGWIVSLLDGTVGDTGRELANGRPVVALIEDRPGVFHYIVIVGLTDRAVIFHDPARAPLRVTSRDEFERRSRAAGRWMALVLPVSRAEEAGARPAPLPSNLPASSSCEERVQRGVSQAQAGDLAAAERTLTEALACPGPAALRELAGVRLLQRRWDDVVQLSAAATSIDPADEYSWKLLGTSRFVLEQPLAALEAWNQVGEPRLDLVRVSGLERTRQQPVERMLGVGTGEVISADRFLRAERALRELPSARATGLELVPVGEGLTELRATIVERGRTPTGRWAWGMIAARAAVARTVGITLGSFSGSGESIALEWRYWPGRPRIGASLRAPAPWPGTWGAEVFREEQEFDLAPPTLERRGGRLMATRWVTSALRLDARGGLERWNTIGTVGSAGVGARIVSGAERLSATVSADGWVGASRFGALGVDVSATSARQPASSAPAPGPVITGTAGAAAVSNRTPFDVWPASDTGQARPVLARAHPLLDHGRIRSDRIGRHLTFASAEAQYWWNAPALSRVGAAVFVDTVRTASRLSAGTLLDIDVGAGVGLASLLAPGRVRVDVAHGLRDGSDAITVRYVATF